MFSASASFMFPGHAAHSFLRLAAKRGNVCVCVRFPFALQLVCVCGVCAEQMIKIGCLVGAGRSENACSTNNDGARRAANSNLRVRVICFSRAHCSVSYVANVCVCVCVSMWHLLAAERNALREV